MVGPHRCRAKEADRWEDEETCAGFHEAVRLLNGISVVAGRMGKGRSCWRACMGCARGCASIAQDGMKSGT